MALQCITVYMDVKFIAAQPGWTYYDGRLFSSEAQYGEEKFTGVLCVRHVCQAEMPSFASLHPLWLGGPASTPLHMHKPRPRAQAAAPSPVLSQRWNPWGSRTTDTNTGRTPCMGWVAGGLM